MKFYRLRYRNPTKNSEWSSPYFTQISDNGNFIAGNATKNGVRHAVLWVKMDLAVDNNRDGEIEFGKSDQTTEDKPYRFWLNNDRDEGDDDLAEDKEPGTVDHVNYAISNRRDLEDFSRIHLEVSSIEDALIAGDLQFGLKWKNAVGDPKIKLYLHSEALGGTGYLTDDVTAGMQISISDYSNTLRDESGARSVSKSNTFVFKRSFFTGLNSSGRPSGRVDQLAQLLPIRRTTCVAMRKQCSQGKVWRKL